MGSDFLPNFYHPKQKVRHQKANFLFLLFEGLRNLSQENIEKVEDGGNY